MKVKMLEYDLIITDSNGKVQGFHHLYPATVETVADELTYYEPLYEDYPELKNADTETMIHFVSYNYDNLIEKYNDYLYESIKSYAQEELKEIYFEDCKA